MAAPSNHQPNPAQIAMPSVPIEYQSEYEKSKAAFSPYYIGFHSSEAKELLSHANSQISWIGSKYVQLPGNKRSFSVNDLIDRISKAFQIARELDTFGLDLSTSDTLDDIIEIAILLHNLNNPVFSTRDAKKVHDYARYFFPCYVSSDSTRLFIEDIVNNKCEINPEVIKNDWQAFERLLSNASSHISWLGTKYITFEGDDRTYNLDEISQRINLTSEGPLSRFGKSTPFEEKCACLISLYHFTNLSKVPIHYLNCFTQIAARVNNWMQDRYFYKKEEKKIKDSLFKPLWPFIAYDGVDVNNDDPAKVHLEIDRLHLNIFCDAMAGSKWHFYTSNISKKNVLDYLKSVHDHMIQIALILYVGRKLQIPLKDLDHEIIFPQYAECECEVLIKKSKVIDENYTNTLRIYSSFFGIEGFFDNNFIKVLKNYCNHQRDPMALWAFIKVLLQTDKQALCDWNDMVKKMDDSSFLDHITSCAELVHNPWTMDEFCGRIAHEWGHVMNKRFEDPSLRSFEDQRFGEIFADLFAAKNPSFGRALINSLKKRKNAEEMLLPLIKTQIESRHDQRLKNFTFSEEENDPHPPVAERIAYLEEALARKRDQS